MSHSSRLPPALSWGRPLVLLLALLIYLAAAAPAPQPAATGESGGATVVARFVPVDLLLHTGKTPLASYQLELTAKNASIVGLEGGDSAAFRDAPFYDPAALEGPAHRIILAAFSTQPAAALPTGVTRVARLHLSVVDAAQPPNAHPDITAKVVVATDSQGQSIPTTLELRYPAQGDPQ
jgi:hypothetical protein